MVKFYTTILLAASVLVLSGCTETYTIGVNGYVETPNPIPQNTKICIITDPHSPNPLYDNEIKAKIVKILSSRGYLPVDDPNSEYKRTFRWGVLPQLVEDYEYVNGGFTHFGRHGVFVGGGYYSPYLRTSWNEWVQIKVYRGDKVVWVGEAATAKYYAEKRRDIDYLLVGAFQFFGQDTRHLKTVEITEKDPRIKELGTYAK